MNILSPTKTITLSLIILLALSACMPASQTAEPQPSPSATSAPTALPTATPTPLPDGYTRYLTQSGDTLPVVAAHFGVDTRDIKAESTLSQTATLDPGTELLIPDILDQTTPTDILFPDSAIVYSPYAVRFDIQNFADQQGGFLSTYTELMVRGTTLASEVIYQLALEHSINPRILLALMETESGWVRANPEEKEKIWYPFGYIRADRSGIYQQTGWAIQQLITGYYGWRAGTLTDLIFADGQTLRLAGSLNAGTVAVLYFFAQSHNYDDWYALVYGEGGIRAIYQDLFKESANPDTTSLKPLFPAGITQPELELPFPPNQVWNLTSGPHSAWGRYGPRAALDFAPPTDRAGCGNSIHWTTAAAPGRVVRVGNGVVVLDLDNDGYEQTGWVLIYMHVANTDRVEKDAFLETDDRIGHPSCKGGSASGVHVHIARKYNGEWVLADGGLPFTMSGYVAAAEEPFCDYAWWGWCRGTLTHPQRIVTADPFGNAGTRIFRPDSDSEFMLKLTPTPQ
jgi:LasA protease